MLNSKAITELLSNNSDERLCKRWFLMTPNGTLLAYSQSSEIRDLRRESAMVALSWQEHSGTGRRGSTDAEGYAVQTRVPGQLRTLTLETESANFIVRSVQPKLLLVLEGGIPPRKTTFQPRLTPEGPGDSAYPSRDGTSSGVLPGSPASSSAGSIQSSASIGILQLHRKKLDAMASVIAQELERTGFKMPDEGGTNYF